MTLYFDLESMVQKCKHGMEIDPEEVRVLCRRSQECHEIVARLKCADKLQLAEDTLVITIEDGGRTLFKELMTFDDMYS